MVTIDAPHMGLNDQRAPANVQMWNTWSVNSTDSRGHIIDWVAEVARRHPSGKLKSVVFCCHGNSAFVQMGEGFTRQHTSMFSAWAGLVDKIWFRACLVARIVTPGSPTTGDGNLFCSEIAKAAQCYVVASTELQAAASGRLLPYGQLDTFEGLLLSYGPQGGVTWSQRYNSTYQRDSSNPGSWTQNPD